MIWIDINEMVNSINGEKIHYMIIANDSYLTTLPHKIKKIEKDL